MRISRRITLATGLALGGYVIASASGCGSDSQDTVGPNVAAVVTANGGNNQVAVLGDPLGDSVAVKVTNARGNPVTNASVAWTVTSGGGSVSPATSTTDVNGVAKAAWTLGKGSTGAN